ncbi:hypothetical protein BJF92_02505 [Rhizobium rhizosphaerae]|uniref:MobA-like NTP transferase domain-containing protein n=1 Tax=Xaviernesmea rhizosphaerae TaxID=1672749 RepID=A0A1Q9AC54_9HYPH|nr:nucleotidyltransferase family protein [Xaviernesmea rhizosphaerae]OLP52468.1 hypothetical protein BJF92_02505 [Xaviernesmea rhizosphaerae]OQP84225.1 hypothetical protein BTR14_19925 [Xaviernesmea rhizosphaerae]
MSLNRTRPSSVALLLLAAGASRRMGGPNKLLARFGGVPLVRRMAAIALASRAREVTVVTGDRAQAIEAALAGLSLRLLHNPDHAQGMGSSLALGVRHLSTLTTAGSMRMDAPKGILVMLADMPGLTHDDLDLLITRFEQAGTQAIVRATSEGRPGNPVILPRSLFPALAALTGDEGARRIIAATDIPVLAVELGPAAHLDVDTPQALVAAGGVPDG